MLSSRKVGVYLVAAGCVLSAMYVVPTISSAVFSRMEIDAFRAHTSQTTAWDRARTRAYRKTLRARMDTPEAVLSISRLGITVPVLDGTSDFTLNRGVGHIDGTSMPGQPGNIAITGHRDGFFRPLKDIARGDVVTLERDGGTDHYVVRDMQIVSPSDTSVLAPTGKDTLTMVTCFPFYFVGPAPKRYIVTAERIDSTQSVAKSVVPEVRKHSTQQSAINPGD